MDLDLSKENINTSTMVYPNETLNYFDSFKKSRINAIILMMEFSKYIDF
jgi:hypothetical protein